MQRKQIQFTDRQVAAIQREARRRKTSDAAVVRTAIDQLLNGAPRPGPPAEQKRRALSAVGRFASGEHDISVAHDRELADGYRK